MRRVIIMYSPRVRTTRSLETVDIRAHQCGIPRETVLLVEGVSVASLEHHLSVRDGGVLPDATRHPFSKSASPALRVDDNVCYPAEHSEVRDDPSEPQLFRAKQENKWERVLQHSLYNWKWPTHAPVCGV